ncbi:MAG TPA: GGDEF domain-containing protein [Abditibacteriaceae bacterium]|jgi:diguanylate cyclase (GGDEF)-like protein
METTPTVSLHQDIETLTQQLAETRAALQSVCIEYDKTRTELEQTRERLQTLARVDEATGLPNHDAFVAKLGEEVRRAARFDMPLSILLVDIDQYDAFQQSSTAKEFEGMLATLMRLMRINTRSVDTFARYNARQFALLLPGTSQEGAMMLAERLCLCVDAQKWPIGEVTMSYGITTLHGNDYIPQSTGIGANDEYSFATEDAEVLSEGTTVVGQAYKVMRHSPLTGRNRVVHALHSTIASIVPWEDVPTVSIIDARGEMTLVELEEIE